MSERVGVLLAMLAGVAIVSGFMSDSSCWAQEVTVRVSQIRASNAGEEFVDPALGELGKQLRAKYRYRSFKLVGSVSRAGAPDATVEYDLANQMKLAIKIGQPADNFVQLNLSIPNVPAFTVRARNGATFLTSVPWGNDALILATTPGF